MDLDLAVIEPIAVQMSFDYDSLDEPTLAFAKEIDAEYDLFAEQTLEGLGRILLKAKAGFSHGEFQSWYFSKGISKTTAWRAMQAAQGKGSKSSKVELLPENAIEPPVEPAEEIQEPRLKRTTNEEKRKTVEDFIAETPQWQEMSNREIARICGVSESLVRTIRTELEPEPTPEPEQVTPPLVESTAPVDNLPPFVDNPPLSEPELEEEPTPEPEPEQPQEAAPEPESIEKKEEEPRASSVPAALLSSESNEWYTPKIYIDAAHELMGGIDLDPASCELANKTVKAADFYHISRNGLDESWTGRVWLNPPYGKEHGKSNQETWTKKLIEEIELEHVKEAILLVNSSTGASWFQPLFDHLICFTDHRIRFYNADSDQPTKENALVYFGTQRKRFIEIFSRFGAVMGRAKADER